MRTRSVWPIVGWVLLGAGALALPACKRGGIGRIDKVRSALASGDAARVRDKMHEVPTCKADTPPPLETCFDAVATAFGSKNGFHPADPDQASAATVATLLVREQRGDWFKNADVWMAAARAGKGPGGDALRLAVATQMVSGVPKLTKAMDDEEGARAFLKATGQAIPGACSTYAALGNGVAEDALPPPEHPDHSPCVQKDLARPDGPGATYGYGVWRAAGGALSLWKNQIAALEAGLAVSEGDAKSALERDVAALKEASAKVAFKPQPPRVNELMGGPMEGHDAPKK